jgi:hypothetical protein
MSRDSLRLKDSTEATEILYEAGIPLIGMNRCALQDLKSGLEVVGLKSYRHKDVAVSEGEGFCLMQASCGSISLSNGLVAGVSSLG